MPLIDCLISFVVAFLFMDTKNNVDLSFVIPCLNEEETIGGVIDEINNALDGSGIKYEIIVSDNGSTDKSKDI